MFWFPDLICQEDSENISKFSSAFITPHFRAQWPQHVTCGSMITWTGRVFPHLLVRGFTTQTYVCALNQANALGRGA